MILQPASQQQHIGELLSIMLPTCRTSCTTVNVIYDPPCKRTTPTPAPKGCGNTDKASCSWIAGGGEVFGIPRPRGKRESLPSPKGKRERAPARFLHLDSTSHPDAARRTHARNETISRFGPPCFFPPTSDLQARLLGICVQKSTRYDRMGT